MDVGMDISQNADEAGGLEKNSESTRSRTRKLTQQEWIFWLHQRRPKADGQDCEHGNS